MKIVFSNIVVYAGEHSYIQCKANRNAK